MNTPDNKNFMKQVENVRRRTAPLVQEQLKRKSMLRDEVGPPAGQFEPQGEVQTGLSFDNSNFYMRQRKLKRDRNEALGTPFSKRKRTGTVPKTKKLRFVPVSRKISGLVPRAVKLRSQKERERSILKGESRTVRFAKKTAQRMRVGTQGYMYGLKTLSNRTSSLLGTATTKMVNTGKSLRDVYDMVSTKIIERVEEFKQELINISKFFNDNKEALREILGETVNFTWTEYENLVDGSVQDFKKILNKINFIVDKITKLYTISNIDKLMRRLERVYSYILMNYNLSNKSKEQLIDISQSLFEARDRYNKLLTTIYLIKKSELRGNRNNTNPQVAAQLNNEIIRNLENDERFQTIKRKANNLIKRIDQLKDLLRTKFGTELYDPPPQTPPVQFIRN